MKNKKTAFNVGGKFSSSDSKNTGSYILNETTIPDGESSNFSYSLPYMYHEQNLTFYTEYKQRIKKKAAITLGVRAEDFRVSAKVQNTEVLYLYTSWNKTLIPEYNYLSRNKPQWAFGVYSQFILPFKIRLNVEYNLSGKGMTQITQYTQNIHELEAVLSRDFKDDKWQVSASFQDILNRNVYLT